jgi:hypothetical protein
MNFTKDLPKPLKVLVRREYLRNLEDGFGEYEEAYVFAVTSLPSRPLLFTIHTEKGAVFTRLPISALCMKPSEPMELGDLQLWSCLEPSIQVVEHKYLKNYTATCFIGDKKYYGRYLFSIDSFPTEGFGESPDQYKIFFVIALENGNICALPTNRILWEDNHFTKVEGKPDYKVNTHYWLTEKEDFKIGEDDKLFYEPRKEGNDET